MAEYDSTDRAREEGNAKSKKRKRELRRWRLLWKEQRAEHQRSGGRVDIEIVEFNRRTCERRSKDSGMLADRIHGLLPCRYGRVCQ